MGSYILPVTLASRMCGFGTCHTVIDPDILVPMRFAFDPQTLHYSKFTLNVLKKR